MSLEYCVGNVLGQSLFCIPKTIIWGIVLFFIGLLISVFVPLRIAKKIGLGLIIGGVVVGIGFTWFVDQFLTNPIFQAVIVGLFLFIVILFILLSGGGDDEVQN